MVKTVAETLIRKGQQLELCTKHDVLFPTKTTWFEHVELVHQAIPCCSIEDLNLSVPFLGRVLRWPFLVGAITGGIPEAEALNRTLAIVADRMSIPFALGSQRAMADDDTLARTYEIRNVAPNVLLLGNIGLSQATQLGAKGLLRLMERIDANGMCLHLNTIMELLQVDGDGAAANAESTIAELAEAFGEQLIVKETGCGVSRETADRLWALGVRTIDVAGAGGTSFARVENLRRQKVPESLRVFEDWGLPTAASLCEIHGLALNCIASGGIRSGLDLAKAIALGASLGSAALPVLRAVVSGGQEAAMQWLASIEQGLKMTMVLTGCRKIEDLQKMSLVLTGRLLTWVQQRGLVYPKARRESDKSSVFRQLPDHYDSQHKTEGASDEFTVFSSME